MANNQITPFPGVPMPFVPPVIPQGEELQKLIRNSVETTIIDVMNNPGNELGSIIKKHVKESMECSETIDSLSKKLHKCEHHHEHEKGDLETIYCKIIDFHKHIADGKSIFEIETEISDKHKDLTPEESKVFSCLLRSDGPVRLASMMGMSIDDFIETMKKLGKRFKD